jgi:TolB-like protein
VPRASPEPGQSRRRGVIRAEQQRARAIEARHDRPDRYPRHFGDLAVTEFVQLAQHDDLAQPRRERVDQLVDAPQIGSALQQRLGTGRRYRDRGAEFRLGFERYGIRRAVARLPAVGGVPNDLEQPAFGIAVSIGVEITQRPQKRLLHDIAGIGIVAHQPARQRVGGIEMRQYDPLEPGVRFEGARDRAPTGLGPPAGIIDLTDADASSGRASRRLFRRLLALGLSLLLVAAFSWILYSRNQVSPKIRSIAILPLENLSSDASQEYFADGMTDELITDLAQISALRVISRTSIMTYKRVRKLLPEIARELDVDAVVEGTVLRSGERVRITAQLIEVPVERHIWAQSFEGDLRDTLALQIS